MTTTRRADLDRIHAAAVRWSSRWGCPLDLLRRLLPPLAQGFAWERPAAAPVSREEVKAAWAALTDRHVSHLASMLEGALQTHEDLGMAQGALVGWLLLAEMDVTAGELEPMQGEFTGWAFSTARMVRAKNAEARARDARRAAATAA